MVWQADNNEAEGGKGRKWEGLEVDDGRQRKGRGSCSD